MGNAEDNLAISISPRRIWVWTRARPITTISDRHLEGHGRENLCVLRAERRKLTYRRLGRVAREAELKALTAVGSGDLLGMNL